MSRNAPVKNPRVKLDFETITTTALELFNEIGYDRTTMDKVAARLGVTKAALYYHVPGGKEAILSHAMHRSLDPLWLSLQEPGAVAGTSSERLRYVLTRQVELVLKGLPDIAYFLLPVAHHPLKLEIQSRRRSYDAAVKEVFERALEEGAIREDLDPSVMFRLVIGMVYSINEWYQPGGRMSPAEIRDVVLALVFRGVGA